MVEAAGSQRAAFELIVAAALGASLHRWRCGLKALEKALRVSAMLLRVDTGSDQANRIETQPT